MKWKQRRGTVGENRGEVGFGDDVQLPSASSPELALPLSVCSGWGLPCPWASSCILKLRILRLWQNVHNIKATASTTAFHARTVLCNQPRELSSSCKTETLQSLNTTHSFSFLSITLLPFIVISVWWLSLGIWLLFIQYHILKVYWCGTKCQNFFPAKG